MKSCYFTAFDHLNR